MATVIIPLVFVVALTATQQIQTAQAQDPVLIKTITAVDDAALGVSLAFVAPDRLVIGGGVPHEGRGYLYDLNGNRLSTFTNPGPASGYGMSWSAGVFGTNLVALGAPWPEPVPDATIRGAIHLFDVSGSFVRTIANPAPSVAGGFGFNLIPLTPDRMLVSTGDPLQKKNLVYLMNTNGTRLRTINDPFPNGKVQDFFPCGLAAVDGNRFLIGDVSYDTALTHFGAVYLFDVGGNLLQVFRSPGDTNYGGFGWSVSMVDASTFLVGEPFGGSGGQVHAFDLNGQHLKSFTSPSPSSGDLFGINFMPLDSERIIIGSASAGCVFSLDGTLLGQVSLPSTGGSYERWFAKVGTDKFAATVRFAGLTPWEVRIYRVPPAPGPKISITRTGSDEMVISWPSPSTGWNLQQNTGLAGGTWTTPPESISDDGNTKSITLNGLTGSRFFLLAK